MCNFDGTLNWATIFAIVLETERQHILHREGGYDTHAAFGPGEHHLSQRLFLYYRQELSSDSMPQMTGRNRSSLKYDYLYVDLREATKQNTTIESSGRKLPQEQLYFRAPHCLYQRCTLTITNCR